MIVGAPRTSTCAADHVYGGLRTFNAKQRMICMVPIVMDIIDIHQSVWQIWRGESGNEGGIWLKQNIVLRAQHQGEKNMYGNAYICISFSFLFTAAPSHA